MQAPRLKFWHNCGLRFCTAHHRLPVFRVPPLYEISLATTTYPGWRNREQRVTANVGSAGGGGGAHGRHLPFAGELGRRYERRGEAWELVRRKGCQAERSRPKHVQEEEQAGFMILFSSPWQYGRGLQENHIPFAVVAFSVAIELLKRSI